MENFVERRTMPPSILEEEDFKDLIERRRIDPVDFGLIEKMASFPKKMFISYHNYFQDERESSLGGLEREAEYYKNEKEKEAEESGAERAGLEEKVAFLDAFIEFAKKYDWCACYHLNRVFERRKK